MRRAPYSAGVLSLGLLAAMSLLAPGCEGSGGTDAGSLDGGGGTAGALDGGGTADAGPSEGAPLCEYDPDLPCERPVAESCPQTTPTEGDFCAVEGARCSYCAGGSSAPWTEATCSSGVWELAELGCGG